MSVVRKISAPGKPAQIPIELINNTKLSARALGVATYICANAFGNIELQQIFHRFDLKEYTWRAISKELRENNIMELVRGVGGSHLIFKY